jgi:D-arabinose 1-dehydrogenase-like Zn-dependent alcohol dehydrogenase
MAETHRAIVLTAYGKALEVKELPVPIAAPGTVVIKVLALYLVDYLKKIYSGELKYPLHLPMTPGGSCVGRIQSVGPDTTSLKEGQLVFTDATMTARDNPAVQFLLGIHTGSTPQTQTLSGNVWRNGSMAELVMMPLENVYALDEEALLIKQGYSIPDLPLLQTFMVPYGGLRNACVSVGDTVIVAPSTGNFGGAAVVVALSMGTKIVACGRSQTKLDQLATAMRGVAGGRLTTIAWTGDANEDANLLQRAVGQKGADVYIDFSPPAAGADGTTPAYISHGLAALKKGGTCVLMGGLTGDVKLPHMKIMMNNIVVRGRFMYDRSDVSQVIKMAEGGMLKLGSHVGHHVQQIFSLDNINEALDAAEGVPGWGKSVALMPQAP